MWVVWIAIQLCLFVSVLVLSSAYGHLEGKVAALNVSPNAQVLISLLFVASTTSSGQKRLEFKHCLLLILGAYHTFVLPVSLGTIDAEARTLVWECCLGGTLVVFNLLAYQYTFSTPGYEYKSAPTSALIM